MSLDETNYEPIPAAGSGAEMFSLPELFYLTNQELIDEWAGLKRTATAAQDGWLQEHVVPAIANLAEGREVDSAFVVEGRWKSSLLVLPGTPFHLGRPVIGFGLAWSATDLSPPFVCVAVDMSSNLGEVAREATLTNGGRDVRSANRFKGERTWPAWRYVNRPDCWWKDLDATRDLLLHEVEAGYELFKEPLRAGVEACRSQDL